MLQDNYLTKNFDSNEKEMCVLKQKVKTLEIENKSLKNDSLLEHNWNLLNHQCCRVIQDTQSNARICIKTLT